MEGLLHFTPAQWCNALVGRTSEGHDICSVIQPERASQRVVERVRAQTSALASARAPDGRTCFPARERKNCMHPTREKGERRREEIVNRKEGERRRKFERRDGKNAFFASPSSFLSDLSKSMSVSS